MAAGAVPSPMDSFLVMRGTKTLPIRMQAHNANGLALAEFLATVVMSAVGGETVTTTVEGRERYSVILRYPRDFRDDPNAIASQVLVPTMSGAMVPLGQVARVDGVQVFV